MRCETIFRTFSVILLAALFVPPARADQPSLESGSIADASSDGGVSALNGQLFVSVPLPITSPQRGGKLNFNFTLTANSVPWSVKYLGSSHSPSSCVPGANACAWTDDLGRAQTIGNLTGGVGLARGWDISLHRTTVISSGCDSSGDPCSTSGVESAHYLITSDGSTHRLQDITANHDMSRYVAIDGSGYQVFQSNLDSNGIYQSALIVDRQGSQFATTWGTAGTNSCRVVTQKSGKPPFVTVTTTSTCDSFTSTSKVTDSNGNVYTLVAPGGGVGTDTKGATPPTEVAPGAANSAACQSVAGLPIASTGTFAYTGFNGAVQTVTECFANYTIQTGFSQSGVNEFPATTKSLMVTAVLPDSTKYTFDYDNYGNLTYVGLPAGGTVRYSWKTVNFGIAGCGNAAQLSRAVQSRTVNDNNGHAYTANYNWGALQADGTLTNTVTDTIGNDTVHIFSTFANANAGGISGTNGCQGVVETSTQRYQGTGSSRTLLEKTDVIYGAVSLPAESSGDFEVGPFIGNVSATSITTTDVVANRVKKVVRVPDTGFGAGKPFFGQTLSQLTYDWGTGAAGALLAETDTAYQWQSDGRYLTAGLFDLPTSKIEKDGAGNEIARTDFQYDGTAGLASSGITLQHGAAPNPVRGNLSQISRWLSTASAPSGAGTPINSPIVQPVFVYDTGMPYQAAQPANTNNRTTFKYDGTGTYVVETDLPSTTNSVLTGKPTIAHATKAAYDFNTGLVTSTTDQSGNISSANYRADNGLPTSMGHADGGSTTYMYSNGFTTVEVQNSIAPGSITDSIAQADGLGRQYLSKQMTANGYDQVDTTYDAFGRASTVSNPHYTFSGPTDGITQNQYDALGRLGGVIEADNSTFQKSFSQTANGVSGVCVVSTDEQLRNRESCADALGRLTAVIEDPVLASNPDAGGLNVETDYSYLTTSNGSTQVIITQKGEPGTAQSLRRVHTATVDSLGRLLSATNPETGTLTYTYDSNGNVLTRTDSRNITATYTYDELNRLLRIAYNDGKTQNALYLYDYAQTGSQTSTNPVGRLVATSTGQNRWFISSFDTMGRVTKLYQCPGDSNGNPVNCTASTASYDFIGDMKSLSAPDGRTVNYTYDQSGWVLSAQDSSGAVYASAVYYAPNGSKTAIVTPVFTYNYVYNKRFQPTQIAHGSTTQTYMVKDYNYGPGNDNGNVLGVTDELDGSRSQTYTYDTLNRLRTANGGNTAGPIVWAENLNYDDWGNLIGKTNTGGAGEQVSITVGTDNRISQFINKAGQTLLTSYDPAGNMTGDGVGTYSYDGWNRMVAAGSASYVYGPNGERWSKSVNSGAQLLYYYGVNGQIIADQSGSAVTDYIYVGGIRLASVNGSTVNYYLADALGSTAKVVDQTGKLLDDQEFFPFGGSVPAVGGVKTGNYFKFTGQPRDAETGLDYFGARYYNSTLGRFMSADWDSKPTGMPYASLGDPQSFNLYAYVRNNPVSLTDGTGHGFAGFSGFMASSGSGGEPTEEAMAVSFEDLGLEDFEPHRIEIIDMTDQVHRPNLIPAAASEEPDAPVPDLSVPGGDEIENLLPYNYGSLDTSADGILQSSIPLGPDIVSQLIGSMYVHPDIEEPAFMRDCGADCRSEFIQSSITADILCVIACSFGMPIAVEGPMVTYDAAGTIGNGVRYNGIPTMFQSTLNVSDEAWAAAEAEGRITGPGWSLNSINYQWLLEHPNPTPVFTGAPYGEFLNELNYLNSVPK